MNTKRVCIIGQHSCNYVAVRSCQCAVRTKSHDTRVAKGITSFRVAIVP